MFRRTYANAYEGALQDLIGLENILHRIQKEMNGDKSDHILILIFISSLQVLFSSKRYFIF